MRVTYVEGQNITRITLTYTETRQFLSSQAAVKAVQDAIKAALDMSTCCAWEKS